jgi:hypothetical protein
MEAFAAHGRPPSLLSVPAPHHSSPSHRDSAAQRMAHRAMASVHKKKGAMLSWHPFACSISVIRLPAIALSAGATAAAAAESTAAATGTLLHWFRFINR